PATAPPTTPAAPPAHPSTPSRPPGVPFPSGGYLGLGAAALLVVALFSVRLWRRRHYVPGSGVRDDLNEAPVIHQLAAAYNTATAERDDDGELVVVRPPGDPHITGRRHAAATATTHAAPPGTRIVGTTGDGQPLALDLAATRGLGLIGPGADAAIRALLVTLLADRHQPDATTAEILVPAADVRRLLGEDTTATLPQRLHIVADLPTLLDRLEADVVTRARRAAAGEDPRRTSLIVLAAPDQTSDRRLQAVLDNGSPLGVFGILYGQWRPGATARVRPDGVVGAASPDIAAALIGNRLFTLPENDTGQLLDLLADADAPAANQEEFRRANPTQGPRRRSSPVSRPASHRPIPARPRLAAGALALGRLVRAALALAALIALIVGLPWGLAHFIGWPLPHHVPSWDEIEARLTGPMDDTLLLDILAVLLWPLWAAFTLSVAVAVPEVVREARWPSHRPPLPAGGMRGLWPRSCWARCCSPFSSPAAPSPRPAGRPRHRPSPPHPPPLGSSRSPPPAAPTRRCRPPPQGPRSCSCRPTVSTTACGGSRTAASATGPAGPRSGPSTTASSRPTGGR
ncbi:hypothetical protein AB1484_38110, partial [Parafrankia sp. FMc6]